MAEKRRYKKSEVTRKKLIDAALEIFADKGYSKTRITDITKKVGLTHAAFYAYFKDKDDLVRSLIAGLAKDFDEFTAAGGQALKLDDPKSLRKTIADMFAIYRKNISLHAAFMEGALQDRSLRNQLNKLNKNIAAPFTKQIKELKKKGKCKEWNPEITGQLLVMMVAYLAVASESGLVSASREATIDNLSRLVYASLNYKK